VSAVTGNLNTIQDSGVQCNNRTDPSAASYLYVQLNEVLMHLGSRVSCIGVIMATMPVLSSRGLDHDSVFKSGEFRVLEARQLARLNFFTKLKVIICFKTFRALTYQLDNWKSNSSNQLPVRRLLPVTRRSSPRPWGLAEAEISSNH